MFLDFSGSQLQILSNISHKPFPKAFELTDQIYHRNDPIPETNFLYQLLLFFYDKIFETT